MATKPSGLVTLYPVDVFIKVFVMPFTSSNFLTIKSFILNNVTNVLVLGSKFKDRYLDEGKAFPTIESTNPPDARIMRPAVNTTAFV